ncbi:MAG: hypothetical protein ABW075_04140, partial [Aeromicrobium sp.]
MVTSSGLIIAFVVVVWAAYFIPLALRRYDEASKNASVETTGGLSRVIARSSRKPVAATARAQQTPPENTPAEKTQADKARPARTADRPAARRAARRRRRTLLTLVAATAIVGGLAGFAVIAPYYVAAPAALIVAWLVACRVQVRRERGIASAKPARSEAPKASRTARIRAKLAATKLPSPKLTRPRLPHPKLARPAPAKTADEEDTIIVSGQFEDIDPGRK